MSDANSCISGLRRIASTRSRAATPEEVLATATPCPHRQAEGPSPSDEASSTVEAADPQPTGYLLDGSGLLEDPPARPRHHRSRPNFRLPPDPRPGQCLSMALHDEAWALSSDPRPSWQRRDPP